MATITLDVDDELLSVLREAGQPVQRTALELMILELYRRRAVSSGWAAARLGMDRFDFIPHASALGIPFIDMTEEEWQAELRTVEEMVEAYRSSPTRVP
jgi:hypothetical protein